MVAPVVVLLFFFLLLLPTDGTAVHAPAPRDAGIPRWNTTVPDHTLPWAGLPRLPPSSATTVRSVYRASPAVGTYNHGPMVVQHGGLIIVNWYAGQTDEDAPGERVLFASSADGGHSFTTPLPMFDRLSPTGAVGSAGVLVSNHEFGVVGDRLYGVAQAHLCTACPAGSIPGKSAGLVRRVRVNSSAGAVQLGPVVWCARTRGSVPSSAAAMAIPLLSEVTDPQLQADVETLMQQTIKEVPVPTPAGVSLTERAVYQREFLSQVQLVMLLRCTSIQYEWASICNLYLTDKQREHQWRRRDSDEAVVVALSDDKSTLQWRVQQIACNWSMAVPTTIPDSHTRTHVGTLPDGRTYLLGTQVSNTSLRHKRDPLTLSLSPDGLSFTQAFALRYGCPDRRYNGSHKDYGYAYPSAVVDRTAAGGGQLIIAYSVNKEDIELMTVALSELR
jgi:hypothetical protein